VPIHSKEVTDGFTELSFALVIEQKVIGLNSTLVISGPLSIAAV
jgi:hypothetical protein